MRMKPTRRSFLKTIAAGVIGNSMIARLPLGAFAKTEQYDDGIEIEKGFKVFNSESQKSLEALADTLVPGARKLGIRQTFMDYISKDPGLAGFFDAGIWNLDAVSENKFKKRFYALAKKEDKMAVVEHVTVRNRLFFKQFRQWVVNFYYSHPQVWKRLSYNGPPQPKGFMDYYLPPQKAS